MHEIFFLGKYVFQTGTYDILSVVANRGGTNAIWTNLYALFRKSPTTLKAPCFLKTKTVLVCRRVCKYTKELAQTNVSFAT